ncbi:glycoside hydrolase family 31 protein [Atopococcus tabaci]|uniref:glycoside hydrolase family 31 protein n=1 Tax=Atopococcus tabaci TaxID=269774 RepID=UPI000417BCE7|nr:glycoside hydrolase family 31 protein [Atopococcus tabaci]
MDIRGKKLYKSHTNPDAAGRAKVIRGAYRFTVLTSQLIRLEYDPTAQFEDRATQTVLDRMFPVPEYSIKESEKTLEINTTDVHVIFHKEEGGFTEHNLRIEMIGNYSQYHSVWYYGQPYETLGGTARTLDRADGPIPLGKGLVSKNGFSVMDDSESMILLDNGWVESRREGIEDLYFFGYGREYLQCLKDFYHLAGPQPLLPRYALGNWWSRYHAYDEEEYKELMERFEEHDIPLSVAVLDMDWHLTDINPQYGSGWTGYTWNRKLFPNPEDFLRWLHEKKLKVTLNLHPANGVQPHEDKYEEMAEALGFNSTEKEVIRFDVTDPAFMDAYFQFLHHPLEDEGVDFWWIDWQQGSITRLADLDPLWMLNHYHYLDSRRKQKRGLIHSRYAGLGSHRYPIGFSGDSIISWESLNFQPYFTATASNVGYGWWSHDIGGFMKGVRDAELYARWVQFGVFSPIMKLHSSSNRFTSKEPWRFGQEVQEIAKNHLRLRHQLLPYLYSMNVLSHREDLPLIRPMYYHHPWEENAYSVPNQYYFGTQLMAAPITKPRDAQTLMGSTTVWLPEGLWIDFFTGRMYHGKRKLDVYRNLENIPVFAKAGAIVPMNEEVRNGVELPKKMTIRVFAGADGQFRLYEDEGDRLEEDTRFAETDYQFKWNEQAQTAEFTIHPARGNVEALPAERFYRLEFIGLRAATAARVWIDGEEKEVNQARRGTNWVVTIPNVAVQKTVRVRFEETALRYNDYEIELVEFLEKAQISHDIKEEVYETITTDSNQAAVIGHLHTLDLERPVLEALSEIIWASPWHKD